MSEKEWTKWIVGGVLSFVALFGGLVLMEAKIKANAQVAVAQEIGSAIVGFAEAWN